jgi:hypothetical protein
VPAQPAGNVREHDVSVVQLDREGGAGKNLFDMAEYLEWSFLNILLALNLRYARTLFSVVPITNRYESRSLS